MCGHGGVRQPIHQAVRQEWTAGDVAGWHSAWSLATTFTASPCQSVPSAIHPKINPGSGLPGQRFGRLRGSAPVVAPSRRAASPRQCYRRQSAANCRWFGRSSSRAPLRSALSRCGGVTAEVPAFRRRRTRSGGCSQPCRHRPQRPASGDLFQSNL